MNQAELQNLIAELPPVEGQTFWDYKRREFRRNVAELDTANFLNWPSIGITMHLGAWPWVDFEYFAVIKERPEWDIALWENAFGGIEFYNRLDPLTSPNLIHMAYHLLQWEKATGRKVQDLKSVVEFGGGFGSMAKLIHRLGFTGQYTIYDLPEMSLLQEFYLSQTLEHHNVQWVNGPHGSGKQPATADLWLATWSFSEVPISDRAGIINQCKPESYLIGYQNIFEWNDNIGWFTEFSRSKPKYQWTTQRLEHQDGEHYYLFGVKK